MGSATVEPALSRFLRIRARAFSFSISRFLNKTKRCVKMGQMDKKDVTLTWPNTWPVHGRVGRQIVHWAGEQPMSTPMALPGPGLAGR